MLNRDKPLFSSSEYYGLLAPPAMGVGVRYLFFLYQVIIIFQCLDDQGVGLKDKLSFEFASLFCELAPVINRRVYLKPIFKTCLIVVLAMTRRYMDNAEPSSRETNSPSTACDFLSIKGWFASMPSRSLPETFATTLPSRPILSLSALYPAFCNNIDLISMFHSSILKVRVEGYREICRKCPGCCSPYDNKYFSALKRREIFPLYFPRQDRTSRIQKGIPCQHIPPLPLQAQSRRRDTSAQAFFF